ncbi:PKD domain-containing protein [Methanosarcina sp. DH2]|uniref:PKD domain-containing protein n=1 Tax=Methanosarcina sp. DH2 TaxID=2605639 RepID=UPI001E2A2C0A|nr:PKD domain-containing protein [Methanosarcina sp. DH2]MCC4769941.1 PKD domain-containing protein [Methanosarcina sp. DH2]
MKPESGTLLKSFFVFFAVFILLSAFPLQVCAENEMTPGIALGNDQILNSPYTLVGGSSSGTSLQPMVTETGKISVSVDGLGTSGSGTIQVEKPTGATVKSAYLIAAGSWGSQIPEGSVLINGNTVVWNSTATSSTCYNYWADVTSFVKPVVDVAPAGRIDFTITETSASSSDGEVLVVIFKDPNQVEDNTVILLFGCQDPTGDTFSIKLGDPINKGNANLIVNMGLGISFSYQASGGSQVSNVDVNGVRVTSSAGGEDDGYSGNGALLTVGGLDDSIENPSDPLAAPINQRTDDELYNLLPFVNNGDTEISVFTQNPSNDDNIFFSYFFLKSTTAMVGEGILLFPASGNVSVGSQYTLASVVQDDDGNPLEGKEVNFSVVSGPNAGQSGSATTDAAGRANFSYSGTSTGTDLIEASFMNTAGEIVTSNQASIGWTAPLIPLPVANFDSNVTLGIQPLTVSFYDLSENAASWHWDFGDGNSSELQNSTHTYFEPGYHTVSLTVNNSVGSSNTSVREDYIFVQALPIPDFSTDIADGTFPLTVQFTDESQYAETVEWNFGDGNSSTDPNPVHTYSEPGLYSVSLIATGNGTSVTKTVEDCTNVTIPPVPDFSANVTDGTFPLTVQFTDESQYAESVEWNFGDGSSSTGLNPVHTYSEAGLYSVSLTATGNGTSVTKTIDSYINVTIPPVPDFSANVTDGTFPLTIQFTDESQYAETLEWSFGDGNSSNELNPIHTYSAAGLYSVSLTATGNGTSVTKTVENYINVVLLPIPDFGANVTTGPYPLTVQFMDNSIYAESVEWDFGDGSGSNERNPVHTYEEHGLYTVTLGASGNETTVNKTVEAFINVTIQPFPPTANFLASLMKGPAPLTVNFTDTSYNAVSWEWDIDGDGKVDYTEENPVHIYETPGSYNVSLYISNAYGNDTKVVEDCINVLTHPVISERTLSKASVYPWEEFTVNLSVESAWDLRNLTVVEDIPAGWILIPIDNAGAEFDSSSNTWVWDNCSADESRQLVYALKAPLDSDFGVFGIEGNVAAEGVTAIPVEGESEVTVTPIAGYNPKDLKLLHVGDPDKEFNISTHMLCNFTWYVNGKDSSEGNAENSAYASLALSPEVLWENEKFKNNYTSVENSSLFAGKYSVTSRVSNGSAAINHTWNFLITKSTESKANINNTVVLPVRKVEKNESVTFNFTEEPDNTDDNIILGISFNASSSGNVSVFIEVLKDKASEVSKDPDGDVYQHINIHFSNQTVMNETGSDSKFIDFKVSRDWLETVVDGTVRLNRYHNGEWKSLNTWKTGSDAEYCYFRAETPGFSPFSVTAEKISTPCGGGHGTGSATIIPSSSEVDGESTSGTESKGTSLTLPEGEEDTLGSHDSDSGKPVSVEEGTHSDEPGSEENDRSEKSGSAGIVFPILLVLLIIGAYLVYRQTKDKK